MENTKPKVLSTGTMKGNGVVNSQGKDLGEIVEFMIDLNTGKIAYAVLSFGGGILNLGDKLFAVPWEALKLKSGEHKFVLNVDKETLKNAEGFDKDDWPDMTSTDWGQKLFDYYGYEPYWE